MVKGFTWTIATAALLSLVVSTVMAGPSGSIVDQSGEHSNYGDMKKAKE